MAVKHEGGMRPQAQACLLFQGSSAPHLAHLHLVKPLMQGLHGPEDELALGMVRSCQALCLSVMQAGNPGQPAISLHQAASPMQPCKVVLQRQADRVRMHSSSAANLFCGEEVVLEPDKSVQCLLLSIVREQLMHTCPDPQAHNNPLSLGICEFERKRMADRQSSR